MKKDDTSATNLSPPPLRGRVRERGFVGIDAARKFRRNQTPAESKLWMALRRKQIEGVIFRRQHPIGRYVADFFCPAANLIVELDGAPHDNDTVYRRDTARTNWLEQRGYSVMRFWNSELDTNFDGVVATIRNAVIAAPAPSPGLRPPSPSGGEGKEGDDDDA
jgi:very-short-patch-repair endonuclease